MSIVICKFPSDPVIVQRACFWDSYPRKGCRHLQVSKWSNSCNGKPVHCGTCGSCHCGPCCYLFSILGQVSSSRSTVSKHQLDSVLCCCWVSILSAIWLRVPVLWKQYALYSYVFFYYVVHLSSPPTIWDIELQTDPSKFCILELSSFLDPEIF